MRPAHSGYERLAQVLSDSDDDEPVGIVDHPARVVASPPHPQPMRHDGGHSLPPASLVPRSSGAKRTRVKRSDSGVDIKAINARLELWADQIAAKFKFKKGRSSVGVAPLEIAYSVFTAPEGFRALASPGGEVLEPAGVVVAEGARFTREQFDEVVESVQFAISKGVDPKLIRQGSSGSYFMRNRDGKVVGVFKPKDEEPYGKLNPKMMKWLHRTLFPCFFGRACLIPNLSYISEAAACLLDRQLRTYLVPYTDVVHLASKAFHYDYWDRRAFYRKHKPLPPKVGSFQVFLQGYQDANIFLKNHPWPDAYNGTLRTDFVPKRRPWKSYCRPGGETIDGDESDRESETPSSSDGRNSRKFAWTAQLQQNFREELEKLIILDYIMRNTDRGLDNWMVRVNWETGDVSIASQPASMTLAPPSPNLPGEIKRSASPAYRIQEPMVATSRSSTPLQTPAATMSIGAIDNSLAFPWQHPSAWRSFPYGWLFLPVSLVGQPFSKKTRDHFIPLLTSTLWWSETQALLRKVFEQDTEFKERMFQKQIAVLKGQAFNVVETLKSPDQGPLELTRRPRFHVWDDEMEVPIAVPLQVPSGDARRRHEDQRYRDLDEEEMDIGVAVASAPVRREYDLLSMSPPRSKLPASVRLGSVNQPVAADPPPVGEELGRSLSDAGQVSPSAGASTLSDVPSHPKHRTHSSHDSGRRGGRYARSDYGDRRRPRGLSHNMSSPSRYLDGDDEDGDLGYSAVGGTENARKKVIVERLEAVKSRNPVFTWC